MANLLQTGSDWLEGMRNSYASQSVTYSRGSDEVTLNATFGKTDYEVDDEYGVRVKGEITDFLLLADDLVLDGTKELPERGDRISVVRNSTSVIFEVVPLSGQGCYRFSDSFGKTLRIHAKQIG